MNLDGKVAVVTGGAVRIGRAISLALADAGTSVLVHYSHSQADADSLLKEITARSGTAAAITADFEHPATAAKTVIDAAFERFGRVDILINSAAIFGLGTLASTTEADWDRHFAINLKGPFFLAREFAARRLPGHPENIINIADWRGLRPVPGHIAYTLTKGALVALTKILALELAPDVRVNAVAPGAILPPAGEGREYLEKLTSQIPLKRTGAVEDLTGAVLYLLRSDFITGEVLCVTGGQQLGC